MNFSSIVGNPPYHKEDEGHAASSVSIYKEFIRKYLNHTEKLLFVVPARWFKGGKKLDSFRKWMKQREDIEHLKFYPNKESPFPNTDISGGVCWILINKNYKGNTNFNGSLIDLDRYDIVVENPEIYSVLEKIRSKTKKDITSIYIPRGNYNISTNDEKLKNKKEKNDIVCYTSQKRNEKKYINKIYCRPDKKWKVATVRANGNSNTGFGMTKIVRPNEVFSDSFIGFEVSNQTKAENLKKYLETTFANFLLIARKVSQDISRFKLKWIPLMDFSKEWTDEKLYDYFGINQKEVNKIKSI